MHVVHLYDGHEKVYAGRGSVPEVVWNIARETAAAGHEVTVVERKWNGLPSNEEIHGVTFERLDLPTGTDEPWERVPYEMVQSTTGLLRLIGDRTSFALSSLQTLRKIDFDVLHVHLPFAANVIVTLAPWLRDRVVYTAHLGELRMNAVASSDESSTNAVADDNVEVPQTLQIVSPDLYLAQRAKRTAVLNPRIQQLFRNRGVAPSKLDVIPNGVNFERFNAVDSEAIEAVIETYDIRTSIVFLFVGTVMPRKGVLELVRAFHQLTKRSGDDVALFIAGENDLDVEYTECVRRAIQGADLQDKIQMLGFVSDEELAGLYSLADVLVMPSLEEGFGMTVVEAMAAGTPVIGTRVGGIDRVVERGIHGWLTDPGDVEGLTEAMSRVAANPEECERMGERAKERAREFSWDRIGQQYLSVYEEVGG